MALINPCYKKFYKYKPMDMWTIRLLQTEKPFFASPDRLNDPSDCLPWTNNDLSEQQCIHYCDKLDIDLDYEGIRNEIPKENWIYYINNRIAQECNKKLRKSVAILSLSDQPDIPLMWSHYADQSRGVCIEFTKNKYMPSPDQEIKPVKIRKDRSINLSSLAAKIVGNIQTEGNFESEIFFSKAPWWEYEHEYRMIKRGDNAEGEHSVDFKITGVFFGINANRTTREIVSDIVKDKDIKLYDIYLKNNGSYEFWAMQTYVGSTNGGG